MARGDAGAARRLLDAGVRCQPVPPFADRHARLARLQVAGRLADLAAVDAEANGLRAAGFRADATLARPSSWPRGQRAGRDPLLAALSEPDLPAITAASVAVARVALLHRLGHAATTSAARRRWSPTCSRARAAAAAVGPRDRGARCRRVHGPAGHRGRPSRRASVRRTRRWCARRPTRHQSEARDRRQGQDPRAPARGEVAGAASPTARSTYCASWRSEQQRHDRPALFVSDNTVKTHLTSIYRKLGVDSRADALAAARDLRVLRPRPRRVGPFRVNPGGLSVLERRGTPEVCRPCPPPGIREERHEHRFIPPVLPGLQWWGLGLRHRHVRRGHAHHRRHLRDPAGDRRHREGRGLRQRDRLRVPVDITTWGWVHLVLGAIGVATGLGLLAGQTWARVTGVAIAVVASLANFAFLPYYPLWSWSSSRSTCW